MLTGTLLAAGMLLPQTECPKCHRWRRKLGLERSETKMAKCTGTNGGWQVHDAITGQNITSCVTFATGGPVGSKCYNMLCLSAPGYFSKVVDPAITYQPGFGTLVPQWSVAVLAVVAIILIAVLVFAVL